MTLLLCSFCLAAGFVSGYGLKAAMTPRNARKNNWTVTHPTWRG